MPVLSRYGDIFDEMCGYYMSIGMSFHDYWDGDNTMTKYYRDMDEHKRDRENFNLWLQACYIYEVLLDASPALKPFVKHPKPRPFMSEPIPLNHGKSKEEKRNEQKMENGKKAMLAMAANFNKKFKEKQEKGGVNNVS